MAYESETPGVARKALTLLAGLVLAAALVAGCGGGSDEADQTRSDFIVEADAICAQYVTTSDTLETQFEMIERMGIQNYIQLQSEAAED